MEYHSCRSERRAYEGRSGNCGLLFTRASSVRDITVVGCQRPASNPSTSRATIQSGSKPPPLNVNPWRRRWGESRGTKERHKDR